MRERLRDLREIVNKTPVITSETKERLYLFYSRRSLEIGDRPDVLLVHPDSQPGDVVSQGENVAVTNVRLRNGESETRRKKTSK